MMAAAPKPTNGTVGFLVITRKFFLNQPISINAIKLKITINRLCIERELYIYGIHKNISYLNSKWPRYGSNVENHYWFWNNQISDGCVNSWIWEDTDPDTFEKFLRLFVYTGQLDWPAFAELEYLADKYLPSLNIAPLLPLYTGMLKRSPVSKELHEAAVIYKVCILKRLYMRSEPRWKVSSRGRMSPTFSAFCRFRIRFRAFCVEGNVLSTSTSKHFDIKTRKCFCIAN